MDDRLVRLRRFVVVAVARPSARRSCQLSKEVVRAERLTLNWNVFTLSMISQRLNLALPLYHIYLI